MKSAEVVIVGGGVIGLSVAYALAGEGVSSTVLDQGDLGRAASWAGAGIIAPSSDSTPSSPAAALRALSSRMHGEWSASLFSETGIDNGYRVSGGVDVAFDEQEEHELRCLAGQWRSEGITFERIEARDLSRVEPALNPEIRVLYFLADRAQIRNPWHLRALIAACEKRGVLLLPHNPVLGFERERDRVTGVKTSSGTVPCGTVVVAAGPWTGRLLEGLGLSIATPPVKGQIVLFRSDRPILKRIVEHGKNYLVPREDGHVLVGATEEDAGFDVRQTPAAVRDLITEALRLCPSLASCQFEKSWAGLRPGSFDTKPYIGFAQGVPNLIVASGHKRAGLQLSPGTAAVVSDLVLGRPPRIDLSPFQPGREPGLPGGEPFRS
jgi:glycine oxidase